MKTVVQLPKELDPTDIPSSVRAGVPFTLPDGRVFVMEETAPLDLGVLEQGRLQKVEAFYVIRAVSSEHACL
ncbi:hypothetical protein NECID01_1497 [Nematocida sp. AWRm77]|nr:hypothetical protein NECID01_1497 [Nematocida sp. AWRm77]